MENKSLSQRMLLATHTLYGMFKGLMIGLCGLLFIAAGANHFFNTEFYEEIVPDYLPNPKFLVLLSGFFEILGGIGMLIPRTRRAASWGLIALLIAVFPANVNMAVNSIDFGLPHELLWWRLPFQLVFILWVYWCGKGKNVRATDIKQENEQRKNE